MKYLPIIFVLFFACSGENPASNSIDKEVELLGWMDIEYIVEAPSLPIIGRNLEPNIGSKGFRHTENNWSEVVSMPITKGDRITLSVSIDAPVLNKTLKIKIIAKGILIAEGQTNSSLNLTYIF